MNGHVGPIEAEAQSICKTLSAKFNEYLEEELRAYWLHKTGSDDILGAIESGAATTEVEVRPSTRTYRINGEDVIVFESSIPQLTFEQCKWNTRAVPVWRHLI